MKISPTTKSGVPRRLKQLAIFSLGIKYLGHGYFTSMGVLYPEGHNLTKRKKKWRQRASSSSYLTPYDAMQLTLIEPPTLWSSLPHGSVHSGIPASTAFLNVIPVPLLAHARIAVLHLIWDKTGEEKEEVREIHINKSSKRLTLTIA